MIKKTIAATFTVASSDIVTDLNVSALNAPARTITPNTPHAAASVGVAMPRTIKPITINMTRPMGRMFVVTIRIRVIILIGGTSYAGAAPGLRSNCSVIIEAYRAARTKPGRKPATRSRPTSISAIAARRTPSADGGIIIARPPVPKIGPIDICLLYPRRCISGTMREPNIAVLAIDEPVRVEKIDPPATVR